jgi:plastocyanin
MRHRIVSVAAAVVLLGCFAVEPANSAVVIKAVSCSSCATGFKWKPNSVSIAHGTKVTWKAVTATHTITAISNNWSKSVRISAGETTSFTFKKAGTYRFRCKIHSSYNATTKRCTGMCGKVVVS